MYNPQLDTFIRVAEAGSFSKAAQESFITPTAVIKQMNLLESRLGLTLFHRSHQGLSLTRAGRSLLADARIHPAARAAGGIKKDTRVLFSFVVGASAVY